MKYFTKEYIKECDCEEIQGLREDLRLRDFIYIDYLIDYLIAVVVGKLINDKYRYMENFYSGINICNRENILWLPDGEQLTEEILKRTSIYNINREPNHEPYHEHTCVDCNEWIIENGEKQLINKNPLIAKIRLLKELIKDEK